ncbi:MAG: VanZ family protein [Clostridia bacterium]|nr:VanZ family protein [Clostridia bacterium]
MKINVLRGILIILLFGTFYLIFGFSSQNATESSGISTEVSKTIVEITNKNISEKVKMQKVKDVEPVIRKLAHFSIYTVVGILLMALACTYKISVKNKVIISIIIGFIYACSDEIHQTFVSRKKRRNS